MDTQKWAGVGAASAAVLALGGYLYIKHNSHHGQERTLVDLLMNDEKISKEEFEQYVARLKKHGGLDDERYGEEKNTLLMLACRLAKPYYVPLLLQQGSSDKLCDSADWQPIHLACLAGSDEIVEILLSHNKENVVAKNQQNGWQPLHIAAAKNNLHQLKLLLSNGAPINEQNLQGHTALIIAACNGSEDMVDYILETKVDVVDLNIKTEKHRETALYLACKNAHTSIVNKLLSFKGPSVVDVDSPSNTGATALHAAIYKGDLDLVKLLVKHGARVNTSKTDGSNCLHICAQSNRTPDIEIAEYLLSLGCELDASNRFGKTPLHDAAFFGNLKLTKLFVEHGATIDCIDNDALTPLHTACSVSGNTKDRTGEHFEVVQYLLSKGADPNLSVDRNCTPLHVAACAGEKAAPIVEALLGSGADPTIESYQEWTPLHCAHNKEYGCPKSAELMESHLMKHNPDLLSTFNKNKPKNVDARPAGILSRLSPEQKQSALNWDVTLEGIAKKILSGGCKKIVVLTGAGISVNAGIPDFRNPKSGLYSANSMQEYGLPSPTAAFDINFIRETPEPFFKLCKKIFMPVYDGKIQPTATHKFIKLLHSKGLLLRNYTQNIDGLEFKCGLPDDLVVESHGTFNRVYCMHCKQTGDVSYFWDCVGKDQLPYCNQCKQPKGILRPDVVFFGEPLPSKFVDMRVQDMKQCDLLIVIGTSLVVYPFAGLVNDVSETTPRLLINMDAVGPFRAISANNNNNNDNGTVKEKENGVLDLGPSPTTNRLNYRDVMYLGNCDDGVHQLCKLLAWNDQL